MADWKTGDSYRKAQWYLVFIAMGVYLAFLIQVHLFPDPRAASQLSKQYHQSERMAMDRGLRFSLHHARPWWSFSRISLARPAAEDQHNSTRF